jgi:hypothetical protein
MDSLSSKVPSMSHSTARNSWLSFIVQPSPFYS